MKKTSKNDIVAYSGNSARQFYGGAMNLGKPEGPIGLVRLKELLPQFVGGYLYGLKVDGTPVRAQLQAWNLRDLELTFVLMGQAQKLGAGWVDVNSLFWTHTISLPASTGDEVRPVATEFRHPSLDPAKHGKVVMRLGFILLHGAIFIEMPYE
ncbi:hypothetical protein KGQ24_02395 [Patescibacteria group bacterium]|nr:hypothetical protein [Patescibacteria group bacterium]